MPELPEAETLIERDGRRIVRANFKTQGAPTMRGRVMFASGHQRPPGPAPFRGLSNDQLAHIGVHLAGEMLPLGQAHQARDLTVEHGDQHGVPVVARRGELTRFEPSYAARPTRYFCAACGTTLFWTSDVFMPGHAGVAGGCFTQAPLGEPTVTATDQKRCAWRGLPQSWFASP